MNNKATNIIMPVVITILLVLATVTLYQSHQNGNRIAARALDRDRQFQQLLANQTTILRRCNITPVK
jgi:uncharacterized membrane protein